MSVSEWVDTFARQPTPRRLEYLQHLKQFVNTTEVVAGVGMLAMVEADSGLFFVSSLVPDGPASSTGQIAAGDYILHVDGRAVRGLALEELRDLLVGGPGSTVTVGLRRRNGHEYAVVITRAVLKMPNLDATTQQALAARERERQVLMSSGGGGMMNGTHHFYQQQEQQQRGVYQHHRNATEEELEQIYGGKLVDSSLLHARYVQSAVVEPPSSSRRGSHVSKQCVGGFEQGSS